MVVTNINYFPFINLTISKSEKLVKSLALRRKRKKVNGISFKKIQIGDVIEVFYNAGYPIAFEGIVICLRGKKTLKSPNVSLTLRNIVLRVPLEFNISYYNHRVYKLNIHDFKRKMKIIRRSRLFFIRYLLNKYSKVK
jgi:ribosomal protein L19